MGNDINEYLLYNNALGCMFTFYVLLCVFLYSTEANKRLKQHWDVKDPVDLLSQQHSEEAFILLVEKRGSSAACGSLENKQTNTKTNKQFSPKSWGRRIWGSEEVGPPLREPPGKYRT